MRSVWFYLVGLSRPDVLACLHRHGFHLIEGITTRGTNLRHETVKGLYVSCGDYFSDMWKGLDEEFQELQRAIDGLTPTVHVSVGISGNIAGDSEVRWLARCLLEEYPGFSFNDFLVYTHAWPLAEINKDEKFDGLGFFDYRSHFERTRARNDA